jgi:uncharacterized protein YqgQ
MACVGEPPNYRGNDPLFNGVLRRRLDIFQMRYLQLHFVYLKQQPQIYSHCNFEVSALLIDVLMGKIHFLTAASIC